MAQELLQFKKPQTFVAGWQQLFTPSVSTLTESKLFVKRVTTLMFSCITYMRNILPEHAYEVKKLGGKKLQLLTGRYNCKEAYLMTRWLKSAYTSIDKGYLKKLTLKILSRDDKVIEFYAVTYKYNPDSCAISVNREKNEEFQFVQSKLQNATATLVRTLLALTETWGPLPRKMKIRFHLEFYDDVAPKDYTPKYFEMDQPVDVSRLANFTKSFVGLLDTNYHSLSVQAGTTIAPKDGSDLDLFGDYNETQVNSESDVAMDQEPTGNVNLNESLNSIIEIDHDKTRSQYWASNTEIRNRLDPSLDLKSVKIKKEPLLLENNISSDSSDSDVLTSKINTKPTRKRKFSNGIKNTVVPVGQSDTVEIKQEPLSFESIPSPSLSLVNHGIKLEWEPTESEVDPGIKLEWEPTDSELDPGFINYKRVEWPIRTSFPLPIVETQIKQEPLSYESSRGTTKIESNATKNQAITTKKWKSNDNGKNQTETMEWNFSKNQSDDTRRQNNLWQQSIQNQSVTQTRNFPVLDETAALRRKVLSPILKENSILEQSKTSINGQSSIGNQSAYQDLTFAVDMTTSESSSALELENYFSRKILEDIQVKCICSLKMENEDLFLCQNCKFYQHFVCYYIMPGSAAPTDGCCYFCAKNNDQLTCTNQELMKLHEWQLTNEAKFRRLIYKLQWYKKINGLTLIKNFSISEKFVDSMIKRLIYNGFVHAIKIEEYYVVLKNRVKQTLNVKFTTDKLKMSTQLAME